MIEHDVEKVSTPPVVHDSTYVDPDTDGEGVLIALKGVPAVGDVPTFDGTDFVPEAPGASASAVWMPLTTVVGGDPELVWDGDDSLIPTLTPI
jgi:hypothetical protein